MRKELHRIVVTPIIYHSLFFPIRYRSYVFTRMGSECYKENRSSKRRYKLKRDHAGATDQELAEIVERPEVVQVKYVGVFVKFSKAFIVLLIVCM